ncbi:MAG: hypothetical protein LBH43_15580 [Treponema sp.]|jgi:hypothetical protein|nr:hypothetical protein [Treponema sp.]
MIDIPEDDPMPKTIEAILSRQSERKGLFPEREDSPVLKMLREDAEKAGKRL